MDAYPSYRELLEALEAAIEEPRSISKFRCRTLIKKAKEKLQKQIERNGWYEDVSSAVKQNTINQCNTAETIIAE